MHFDWSQTYTSFGFTIPSHMMPALERYVMKGIIPGDFLQAVICNDLAGAIGKGDSLNVANLPAYVRFFFNQCPSGCFGNIEKMHAWKRLGGYEGFEEKHNIHA